LDLPLLRLQGCVASVVVFCFLFLVAMYLPFLWLRGSDLRSSFVSVLELYLPLRDLRVLLSCVFLCCCLFHTYRFCLFHTYRFCLFHTYLGCCVSAGLRSGRLRSWTYESVTGVVIGRTGHCRGSVRDRVRVFCESCCILSSVAVVKPAGVAVICAPILNRLGV